MVCSRSQFWSKRPTLRILSFPRVWVFGLAAFLFPALVRVVPEIVAGPYPIGYDTVNSYAPFMLDWGLGNSTFSPVIGGWVVYALFGGIYIATRIDPIVIVKTAAPIFYGVLGVSEFIFAQRVLRWRHGKSLFLVMVASMDFVLLRFSWDLFRNTLGLALLLLYFAYRTDPNSWRKEIVFTFLAWLVVVTHVLVGVVLVGIVCLELITSARTPQLKKVVPIIPASAQIVSSVIGLQGQGISIVAGGGPSTIVSVSALALTVLVPIVSLAFFGYRSLKSRLVGCWVLICLIGLLSETQPISISSELVAPERWLLMLGVPVVFYAIEGVSRLLASSSLGKVTVRRAVGLCWLTIFVALGVAFVGLPASDALSYFSSFTPTSMLQSSVPLEDSRSLVSSFSWLSANIDQGSVLMTHHAMYGWARLYFHGNNPLIAYPPQTTLEQGLVLTISQGYAEIYTVWWTDHYGWYGESTVPACFQEVHHEGRMGVYLCLARVT